MMDGGILKDQNNQHSIYFPCHFVLGEPGKMLARWEAVRSHNQSVNSTRDTE